MRPQPQPRWGDVRSRPPRVKVSAASLRPARRRARPLALRRGSSISCLKRSRSPRTGCTPAASGPEPRSNHQPSAFEPPQCARCRRTLLHPPSHETSWVDCLWRSADHVLEPRCFDARVTTKRPGLHSCRAGGPAELLRRGLPARTHGVPVGEMCRDRRSSHGDCHAVAGLTSDVADRDLAVLILRRRDRTAAGTDSSQRSQRRQHGRRKQHRGKRALPPRRGDSTHKTPLVRSVSDPRPFLFLRVDGLQL
jgi:hypothetical protein